MRIDHRRFIAILVIPTVFFSVLLLQSNIQTIFAQNTGAVESLTLVSTHKSEFILCFSPLKSIQPIFNELNSGEIKKIDLRYNEIQSINLLKDISNENKQKIEYLELSGNGISDLSPLADYANLKYLYLNNNVINDISSLSHLRKLEVLQLSGNQISDISALGDLTGLKQLHLDNNRINDAEALLKLTELSDLKLSRNNLTSAEALKGLTQLSLLDVSYNQINKAGFLKGMTGLKNLNISNNSIEAINLSEIKNLSCLLVSENPLSLNDTIYPEVKPVINDYDKDYNFKAFRTDYELLREHVLVMDARDGVVWAAWFQGNALLKSVDSGANWTTACHFPAPVNAIYCDDYGNIFVTTSKDRYAETGTGELYKSKDGGTTFYKVLVIEAGVSINWNIAGQNGLMFLSEYGYKGSRNNARRIYRSLDFGENWEIVYEPEEKTNYHNHKVVICEDGTVYQSIGDRGHYGILKSADNGDSWDKVVSNIHPTSAVELDTHILWGLDSYPVSGIVSFNKQTEKIDSIFSLPYPFAGSCYDMKEVNGIVYAAFLSYADWESHPASIFYSEDGGLRWKSLGYIEKESKQGIGLYNLSFDENYGYINFGAPVYRDGAAEKYRGTLRFELLEK